MVFATSRWVELIHWHEYLNYSLGMLTPMSQNVFWKLDNTDVYAALSWDRLHAYHGGLFSDHLWVRFKEIITALGRSSCEKFDIQYVLNSPRPGFHYSNKL